ncbi:hypothetical protein GF359_08475 [candidate division WOR-3 bacterium]|uniref:Uncharacterized protein n=1 Tax=candidate division WOR-3 bacterium TaxID=2052148 RepID=A0A9D5QD43_UNCW3|nr:hypothetical protein [candidate division WOR-3 bacterium]MBD3365234.1 hypothetical protein [candidate division WOR-3 bacterium]
MKCFLISFLTFTIFISAARDPLDEVLEKGGLTREDVHFDRPLMDLYGGGPHRLRLFDLLANRPLEIPYYNKLFVHQLFEGGESISKGVFFVSLRTDAAVRRGLIKHPYPAFKEALAGKEDKFFYALDELNRVAGNENVIYDFMTPVWSDEFEGVFSVLLLACAQAIEYRNLAFRDFSADELERLWSNALGYAGDDTTMSAQDYYFVEECIHRVEYSLLYAGLEDLAMVLDSVLPVLDSMELENHRMEFETPYGTIKIAGKGDDYYSKKDYLLLIETGGDDSYGRAGANWDAGHPLSVVIDLAGDDGYMNEGFEPSIAAGILGAGMIVDLGGNDLYKSNGPGIGGGLFGIGILYDKSGDDNYDGYANCEGAGVFGAGILTDVEGADTYRGFRGIQGYGFTKGCGLLLDMAGDDFYIARNDSVPFPSPQSLDHNANMAQGFGFGKRADFTDGRSLAGGVGVLADGGGDDIYDAGVFAQGAGYWYGVGLLTDKSGDDIYSGVWYVQGSGAHFAVGVLNDVGGNDEYSAEKNMAQGAGHDFTVGYLLEEEGNDIYNAPNLSLGGGNASGIGIFWDRQGEDTYNVTAKTTLGLANIGSRGGLRDGLICAGIFLDTGGGSDTYPEDKPARNNKSWFQPGLNADEPLETEIGVGLDR